MFAGSQAAQREPKDEFVLDKVAIRDASASLIFMRRMLRRLRLSDEGAEYVTMGKLEDARTARDVQPHPKHPRTTARMTLSSLGVADPEVIWMFARILYPIMEYAILVLIQKLPRLLIQRLDCFLEG